MTRGYRIAHLSRPILKNTEAAAERHNLGGKTLRRKKLAEENTQTEPKMKKLKHDSTFAGT